MSNRVLNGRYQAELADMRKNSVVARIVLDELDTFWESVSSKLNELRSEEYDEDTHKAIADAKGDIKAAIAARFGKPMSTVVTMKRAVSGWNLFTSENRQKVKEGLENLGQRLCFLSLLLTVASDFTHVTKELSALWERADKEPYQSRAKRKSEELDELLEDPGKATKRRRKTLWTNMKKSVALQVIWSSHKCDILDSVHGVTTLIFQADRLDCHVAPVVYYPGADSKNARTGCEIYNELLNRRKSHSYRS